MWHEHLPMSLNTTPKDLISWYMAILCFIYLFPYCLTDSPFFPLSGLKILFLCISLCSCLIIFFFLTSHTVLRLWVLNINCSFKSIFSLGLLGGSVSWASNFSLGHDLTVCGLSPALGSLLSAQSLLQILILPLSTPPPLVHNSLSPKNKQTLKNFLNIFSLNSLIVIMLDFSPLCNT